MWKVFYNCSSGPLALALPPAKSILQLAHLHPVTPEFKHLWCRILRAFRVSAEADRLPGVDRCIPPAQHIPSYERASAPLASCRILHSFSLYPDSLISAPSVTPEFKHLWCHILRAFRIPAEADRLPGVDRRFLRLGNLSSDSITSERLSPIYVSSSCRSRHPPD